VDTLQGMAKKDEEAQPERKAPPERWRGDAVEERPGDEAERGAERAEGNTPIPVDVERERIQEPPDPDQQPLRVGRRAPHAEDPEEEIADAAEEHQERRAPNERPPRGKL
jgi:hypothetical protein